MGGDPVSGIPLKKERKKEIDCGCLDPARTRTVIQEGVVCYSILLTRGENYKRPPAQVALGSSPKLSAVGLCYVECKVLPVKTNSGYFKDAEVNKNPGKP